MSNGQQNQQSQRLQSGDMFDMVYFLSNIHASAIANVIRRDFGREALGWNSFLAMFVILFLYAGTADKAMLAFLGVWFVCRSCREFVLTACFETGRSSIVDTPVIPTWQ